METITSKRRGARSQAAMPPSTKRDSYRALRPQRSAFALDRACAVGQMSMPTQRAFGRRFSKAKPMAPVPQPTSRISISLLRHAPRPPVRRSSPNATSTCSTSSSVSGRGIRTGGRISSVRSWKSQSPRMYCTGTRSKRRLHMRSKARAAASSSGSDACSVSCLRSLPKPAHRVSRCSAERAGSGTAAATKASVASWSAALSGVVAGNWKLLTAALEAIEHRRRSGRLTQRGGMRGAGRSGASPSVSHVCEWKSFTK